MGEKIIIGKNGNEHGIWVSRPGQTVQDGGPYLMSSVADMLKIHAQGSVPAPGLYNSGGLWSHNVEVEFPELPFIPLVFWGIKTSEAEPFQFPPNLDDSQTYNGTTLGNLIPVMGWDHKRLVFRGWTRQRDVDLNYTVFLLKLRDKF